MLILMLYMLSFVSLVLFFWPWSFEEGGRVVSVERDLASNRGSPCCGIIAGAGTILGCPKSLLKHYKTAYIINSYKFNGDMLCHLRKTISYDSYCTIIHIKSSGKMLPPHMCFISEMNR